MEETEKTDKKVNKSYLFQKGDDPRRNLDGRPVGTKNFSTLFREAIKQIAEEEGTDAEKELVLEAIRQAKEGKYQYHKDIFDRVYGSAPQSLDLTSAGKELPTPLLHVLDKQCQENQEHSQENK